MKPQPDDWAGVPEALLCPAEHYSLVKSEFESAIADPASSRRTAVVQRRVGEVMKKTPTDWGGEIDWELELKGFGTLNYPSYFRQPFHSVPGGWLSKTAALVNRMAMQAIYREAHVESCMGLRKDLSALVPSDAQLVVDLGAGDGDGPAATSRLLPKAKVLAVEASPFMIIAGRRQNRDCPNLEFRHALAEETHLQTGSADAVTITLVFHECSDDGKAAILREAYRILRPGGSLVFADTPQSDLLTYRGFYEPWKEQWARFDPRVFFETAGFREVQDHGILGGDRSVKSVEEHRTSEGTTDNRLFVITCKKPLRAAL